MLCQILSTPNPPIQWGPLYTTAAAAFLRSPCRGRQDNQRSYSHQGSQHVSYLSRSKALPQREQKLSNSNSKIETLIISSETWTSKHNRNFRKVSSGKEFYFESPHCSRAVQTKNVQGHSSDQKVSRGQSTRLNIRPRIQSPHKYVFDLPLSLLRSRKSLQVGNAFLEGGCLLVGGDGSLHVTDDPVNHVLLLHASQHIRGLHLIVKEWLSSMKGRSFLVITW